MKFLIVFALALSTASAFHLANSKLGITNGKDATNGQFRYQVGLYLELGPTHGSWCGGSLIGDRWVLTATHCTEAAKSVIVYLGATNRNEPEIQHTVSSNKIINHHRYDSSTLNNDISLIEIPSTPNTDSIQTVKLPAISSSYSTYAGEDVIASGWGRVSDSGKDLPNVLQWALLNVITNDVCAKSFGRLIVSSTICTSTTGGISICQGDSGGPLVLKSSNVQVGLSSFVAAKGCTLEHPAAFTRLTSYLDWIKEKTGISY